MSGNKIPKRLFVYPKDIIAITGRSKSNAYKLYQTMKDAFCKNPNQALTVAEVSSYLGITEEQLIPYLT